MKKFNVFKILTIAILVTIVLSYFIPGTTISYGTVDKGTILPVTFADTITNGLTSLSAFMTAFVFILVIGIFYATLYKTNKYEVLVNNVATKFKKNKGLAVILTIITLGLVTMFTGELYSMLIFVPFLISVIRKLGYSKETSLLATVGSVLIGHSGAIYTYYINQMISLTFKDTIMPRVIVSIVGLLALIVFILVFSDRPEKTNLETIKERKMLPLHITLWSLLILLILGFVNWNGYFGFEGFDTFLATLRDFEIAKVSVFNIIIGQSIVAFGTWQVYNAVVLFIFISVLLMLIYRFKINDIFETFANGLKKAFPYALIVVIANIVLVNVFSSGIFYTIVIALTEKTVNLATSALSSILAAFAYPDYTYAAQFTLTAVLNTKAKGYEILFASIFQAVYSLVLLVSPTSILLLLGLKYTDTSYKTWFKYIYKFFIVLLITILVVITLAVKEIDALSIVALVLLVIAVAIMFYLRINSVSKKIIAEKIKKEEAKEVKVEKKETKKAPAKKTTKKQTKKTNKK